MPPLEVLLLALFSLAQPESPQINPIPRAVLRRTLAEWNFDQDADGWAAEQHCIVSAEDGLLKITATEDDPYMHRRVDYPGGDLVVEFRARSPSAQSGSIYWTTSESPQRGEDKVRSFPLNRDGQWHDYSVPFHAPGTLTDLRIDPGTTPGTFEIDWIRLAREELHPLTVESVQTTDQHVRFTVKNHRSEPVEFSTLGQRHEIGANRTMQLAEPARHDKPLEAVSLELVTGDFPPVRRTFFVHHLEAETDWIVRPLGDFSLQVARDGSLARVYRGSELVGVIAPLVHSGGKLPALDLVEESPSLRFRGEDVTVTVAIEENEVTVSIDGPETCEGPVVRALGSLEQGLFAGLEYLGKGETSSSKLDVETDEHLRFAPDPTKVTMPLMAFVTDRASVAMTWSDMTLQPVFATPNFFDATDDHRMALRGPKIEATLQFDRLLLEETIHWAVARQGLPPLPDPPRSRDAQWKLCLEALNGPLRTEAGWGHCVEERWPRHPYADMASTLWRLTGEVPELPRLVPNGAHVRNESIFFVSGRAAEWKEIHEAQVRGILSQQQADGSFRYAGKYARGHFEDTASGVCARPAATLLEYAWITGDTAALEAGVRTLEYMKRFRTPRGAQVWEVPLHTPDLLASAYLVWAYVRGYELTGKDEYLEQARKWALSGVPFVYLWGRYPIMLYATPPVFGATDWQGCWIGLPVQWVGLVYAYALTMLAPYDDSLDWNQLARGILISGEQQQYPDGEYAGLLPDSVVLQTQERRPWRINPCALVSLRLVLDGQLDSLSVAADGKHRVAAPFPVTLREGRAHVQARSGVAYQILVDGSTIVDVTSQGNDVVPLE
ncbi:MAG: hypothetical protein A2V98_11010 [Planctomycetes bacterium RBG_16_64_12]|nr:MAG: hypothetical protein A2V98_11010 [Planctomycetes bacterium RBG_16_64_12]